MMRETYYYQLLELQPGASPGEVKAAYRRLVKMYHPDLAGGRANSGKFNEIVTAYRSLALNQSPVMDFRPAGEYDFRRRKSTASPGSKLFTYLARSGKILLSSGQASLRRNAAISLGLSGKKSAYAYLRRALDDRHPEVVLAVVKAIARLRIVQAGGDLGVLFLRTTRQVKLAILDLARIMRDYPGFEYILHLGLRDTDPVIKHFVLVEKPGR